MLTNATYNLMESASVISKGLYRYDTFIRDAAGCQQCEEIWNRLKRRDEEELAQLVSHLKQHLGKEDEAARPVAA
jgi:hypothetical protein